MTIDEARDAVADALAELGRTPRDVANRLLAEGCLGARCSAHACPLVRYLEKRFPAWLFRAGHLTVSFIAVQRGEPNVCGGVPMTWGVTEFVDDFDDGWFAELHQIEK